MIISLVLSQVCPLPRNLVILSGTTLTASPLHRRIASTYAAPTRCLAWRPYTTFGLQAIWALMEIAEGLPSEQFVAKNLNLPVAYRR